MRIALKETWEIIFLFSIFCLFFKRSGEKNMIRLTVVNHERQHQFKKKKFQKLNVVCLIHIVYRYRMH